MSYTVNDLAVSPTIRSRILTTIVKVAGSVQIEQSAQPIARRTKRVEFARLVLTDPEQAVGRFVWPVLSNTTIVTAGFDVEDAALEYQVAQVWDSLSGVTAADLVAEVPAPPIVEP